MTLLADWLQTLGAAGLDWFWRPLMAWTLACVPLYAGLRLWRSAPPLVQYHAHLALLLALPLSLALAPFLGWPASLPEVAVLPIDAPALPTPPVETLPPAEAAPVALTEPTPGIGWGTAHWMGILTALAFGTAAFLLLRMFYLAYGLRGFRRGLVPVEAPEAHRLLRTLSREVGVREAVLLYSTPDETTPMTFGWRRPVIVVPTGLVNDEHALRLTLRHELIHVRRRDYAVGWIVRLVGCATAVHPGVWLLRRRIDQYREISCDAETLAEAPGDARRYARLLLRFSPLTDLAGPTALRMVELDSTLKKRLHAMHNAVRFPSSLRLRRWSLLMAAAILLIPALLAACATENSSSETVIVSPEAIDESVAEEISQSKIRVMEMEEGLAKQAMGEELAKRERELALAERQRALEEAEWEYRQAVEFQEDRENDRRREGAFGKEQLKVLTMQMEYLKKEMTQAEELLSIDEETGKPVAFSQGVSYQLTRQRVELLRAMYMQRLEQYETMKMEQFTREALAERE